MPALLFNMMQHDIYTHSFSLKMQAPIHMFRGVRWLAGWLAAYAPSAIQEIYKCIYIYIYIGYTNKHIYIYIYI